jgi:hypothetical protein
MAISDSGLYRAGIGLALMTCLVAGMALARPPAGTAPASSMFAGTWMANFGGNDGSVDISPPSPRLTRYNVEVSIADEDCTGVVDGIAVRERTLLELNSNEGEGPVCRIYILRTPKGLKIWEASADGKSCDRKHGEGCRFDGTAYRLSAYSEQEAPPDPSAPPEEKLARH